MKALSILALLSLAAASPRGSHIQAEGPDKLALIIAIGTYDSFKTGWPTINSGNDVTIIKDALLRIGFAETDITVLQDDKADKKGILNALADLKNKATPGSMVAVHVSAHGQQISDNNDNDEIDGYDEAIVAFGAPSSDKFFKGKTKYYDGSLHLRDDEFGTAIDDIRAKIGVKGHVLVTLDACHSETITRGTSNIRGEEPPYDLRGIPKPAEPGSIEGEGFGMDFSKSNNIGKLVVMSGSLAKEVNYEYLDRSDNPETAYGSLSYCFSKALPALAKNATYRSLFAAIQSEMATKVPSQTPQIEGDIDFGVFAGNYKEQQRYFPVAVIVNDKSIFIRAGKLMGITEGSGVVVEKGGTNAPRSKEAALSFGKVVKSNQVDATIQLEKPLPGIDNVKDYWVFVTNPAIGTTVKLSVDGLDVTTRTKLVTSLKKVPLAEIVPMKNAEVGVKDTTVRGVKMMFVKNLSFGAMVSNKPVATVDEIISDIQNYSQGKMIKELDSENENFKVRITRLVPSKTRSLSDTVQATGVKRNGAIVEVKTDGNGRFIFLEIENFGPQRTYFNVIDIEPGGAVNPIFPPRTYDATGRPSGIISKENFVLEAGEKKVFNYSINMTPPYGTEVFKVVSAGRPFDLTSTIVTRGGGTRGADLNEFEQMLGESYGSEFSRGGARGPTESQVSTAEFVFRIVR
jgi:hypothetical protein